MDENSFADVEDWLDYMAAYEHDFPPDEPEEE